LAGFVKDIDQVGSRRDFDLYPAKVCRHNLDMCGHSGLRKTSSKLDLADNAWFLSFRNKESNFEALVQ
jgi:hypothetical protein